MRRKRVQYTIRQIPEEVDLALRETAQRDQTSLNQSAVEALARGLGVADKPVVHHDLDALAGTWEDDPAFDEAIRNQKRIDRELWR